MSNRSSSSCKTKIIGYTRIQQILEAIQFDNMHTLDDIKVKVNEICASEIQR